MNTKNKWALFSLLTIIGISLAGAIYYGMGRGSSHMEGIDYSDYMSWWILGFLSILSAFAGALLLRIYVWKGKAGTIFVIIMTIILMFPVAQVFSALRAFANDGSAEDIAISTATSGDFQLNDAKVESYTNLDEGGFWTFPFRIMTFDENYGMVFDINATQNFTVYNSTVATLTGYNIDGVATASAYAPVTQPGDFTTSSGAISVKFVDVPQNMDSPAKVTVFYNLSLYDDIDADGVDDLLASWIIHTSPLIKDWSIDITV